jgi:predicted Rossmann fold nucleotide-binding protein DprA/Smf involved in DNA uptake
MKVAIVGSRSLTIDESLELFVPKNTNEIISGGAHGIDQCAAKFAVSHNIKLTEIKPDYKQFGRYAPLKRNIEIIKLADYVIVLWDGISHGSKFVIQECKRQNKPSKVYLFNKIDNKKHE